MPFQRVIKGEHEILFTEKLGRPTPLYLEELSIFLTSRINGELKALYHYGFQYRLLMLYLPTTTIELKNGKLILGIHGQICIVLLFIKYIKSLLFFPKDQQVQDLKSTSLSKSPKENKEKDAPNFAVNKRFLKVNSVDVNQCEGEVSEIPKVDKNFKTTVSHADVSG